MEMTSNFLILSLRPYALLIHVSAVSCFDLKKKGFTENFFKSTPNGLKRVNNMVLRCTFANGNFLVRMVWAGIQ